MKVGGSSGGEAVRTAMPHPTPPHPSEQEACEVSARHPATPSAALLQARVTRAAQYLLLLPALSWSSQSGFGP